LTKSSVAALGWGASDYFGGRTTAGRGVSVFAVVALAEAAGALGLVPVLLVHDPTIPPIASVIPAAVAGVGVTVELTLVYAALSRGDAFITAPVGALGAALASGIGIAGGDRLSTLAGIGLICALSGGGLGSWTSPTSASRAGLVRNAAVALGAAGAISVTLTCLHAAGRFDPYRVTAIEHATTAICASMLAAVGARHTTAGEPGQRSTGLTRRQVGWVALTAVAGTAGDVCYTAASHHGALTIVAAIASLYPAATIVLGRLLAHDRATWVQFAGVVLALAGTVLLSVALR
jgi:uncharacterized membrane protein